MYKYPLTTANLTRLRRAAAGAQQVDMGIRCVLENAMGEVWTAASVDPVAFLIEQDRFFIYGVGDMASEEAAELARSITVPRLAMPACPGWSALVKAAHPAAITVDRTTFSSAQLEVEWLQDHLIRTRFADQIKAIDLTLAERAWRSPESYLSLGAFRSAADFIDRGMGFCLEAEGEMVAVAYSSLICSQGLEVSIVVDPAYRRRGIATALGARLLLQSLAAGLQPNWDAANPESCALALKLGYESMGSYQAYYLAPDP